jgi:hypothetical protein
MPPKSWDQRPPELFALPIGRLRVDIRYQTRKRVPYLLPSVEHIESSVSANTKHHIEFQQNDGGLTW